MLTLPSTSLNLTPIQLVFIQQVSDEFQSEDLIFHLLVVNILRNINRRGVAKLGILNV